MYTISDLLLGLENAQTVHGMDISQQDQDILQQFILFCMNTPTLKARTKFQSGCTSMVAKEARFRVGT